MVGWIGVGQEVFEGRFWGLRVVSNIPTHLRYILYGVIHSSHCRLN